MAWSTLSDLVGASDGAFAPRTARRAPEDTRKPEGDALGGVTSWLASMFDVKCCAMRDRCVEDTHVHGERTQPANQFPSPCGGSQLDSAVHTQGTSRRRRAQPEPLHSPAQMPKELPGKIASLIAPDPYIAREIGERASRCLRLQFVKQCVLGHRGRCGEIWATLDERDRLDFMAIYRLGAKTPDRFFLNIMEPDAQTWKEELSEYDSTRSSSHEGRVQGSQSSISARSHGSNAF